MIFKGIYNFFHRHYHTRYLGVYRHAKQLFVFDLVLLAFAILMLGSAGYFYIWKPGPAKNVLINISFGTERILSGNKVQMTIDYTNNSKETIGDAVLAVRLPRGFIVDESKTTGLNSKNNTFEIGSLPSGSTGQVKIVGTLWANVGELEKIISTLSFKPENKNNTDQASGIYLLKLTDSVLEASLKVPTKSYSGQKLTYSVFLNNTGSDELSNIKIVVGGKERNSVALLPSATTSVSETITTPDKGGRYKLTSEIKTIIGERAYTQKVLTADIDLLNPRVTLSSGSTSAVPYVEPEMILPIEIMWKNDGQLKLNDQKIILQTTPGVVDLAATAKENLITRSGNNLIIDAKSRTALAGGSPGAGETFTLKLIIAKNFENKAVGVNRLTIKPVFEATAEGMDEQVFSFTGKDAVLPLAAEVFLQTDARYYTDDGDQLGRGPLSPQVGKTTRYWIFATLYDKVNPIAASKLTFNLAPGVVFTGKQSVTIGPELIYNETDRTVTWNYGGVIPADSESGFYFEVAVTPKPEQAGYILNLLTGASYYGVDDEVGKVFTITTKNTSNILPEGDAGRKRGAIVTQ